jgi:hypothetical protein
MKINAAWHKKNPMAMGTNIAQRTDWHVAHAKACGCREMPPKVLKELARRGQMPPTRTTASPIKTYNAALSSVDQVITDLLADTIDKHLKGATKAVVIESKIWHGHPVWFLDGNPIVGYSRQKAGVRLMFWSGASFEEAGLDVVGKKFKDASTFFNAPDEVDVKALKRWLKKSAAIQWDYKNIVKRKGRLVRVK